ncbi:hypothetical protein Pan216_57050 [Planctomycetes bacterium Pan216]|uniref:DUF6795 domain-containing protein n=1 Tax=Kolteria novifilia TaxID=2527975 RepID=A0A518BCV1_9BACT|nr:hypothetical protein Pan216_57050 [Planctomycetes bacterium Pan216]
MKPWYVAVSTLVIVGCGSSGPMDKWEKSRPPVYPVSGVVTLAGEPVEGAVVLFQSQEKSRSAYGTTDAAGRFQLTTFEASDGAVAGPQRVSINKSIETAAEASEEDRRGASSKPKITWLTPERYASFDTSELTVNVLEDQSNEFAFDLKK